MIDIALFALLFFLLVFVHELGHFLMAKLVGIRVEKFSIGMGPKILGFKKGDTEYKICLLPLGGYVKMSGDDPSKTYSDEERRVGFLTQKPPAKLLVVFGGPVFNLIYPIFLFGLMLAIGTPVVESVVGRVEEGQPAALVGLQPGDRIVAIDGQEVSRWSQVEKAVDQSQGRPLQIQVQRRQTNADAWETINIEVAPAMVPGRTRFGEEAIVARLGISPEFVVPDIYFEDPASPLAKAGLQALDHVVSIDGVSVFDATDLEQRISGLKPGLHQFIVDRDGKRIEAEVNVPAGKGSVASRLKLVPSNLVLGQVQKSCPADEAGLKAGDRLVSINGQPLSKWEDVASLIRSSEGKPVHISWMRAYQEMSASVTPLLLHGARDPLLGKDLSSASGPAYRIGVGQLRSTDVVLGKEQSFNPLAWLMKGLTDTWATTTMTAEAIWKLCTGQLSIKLLGSPIMIYKAAGNSYRLAGGGTRGWVSFISLMALLSISLGLFNLIPIPVLDGGHAAFFIAEWIRGKPVSLRFMEIASQVGVVLLIALLVVVLFHDFQRYDLLEQLKRLFTNEKACF